MITSKICSRFFAVSFCIGLLTLFNLAAVAQDAEPIFG